MKTLHLLFLALLLTAIPAFAATPQRIAVLCAFGPELDALRSEMIPAKADVKTSTINGTRFDEVDINGRHFIFAMTGMSMINAAMTTQLVIDRFHVDAIVVSGIAGGINPLLHVGDVIIPAKWIHQMESVWPNPEAGNPDKYILPDWFQPKFGHYHGIFPADVEVVRDEGKKPETMHAFPADPDLLALATKLAPEIKIEGLRKSQATVIIGTQAMSGPVFLDNGEYGRFAHEVLQVDGHDMESTAVAQVAWVNHIPVLIIRGLSDLAGEQEGPNEEREFLEIAARNAAIVTSKVLLSLPAPAAAK